MSEREETRDEYLDREALHEVEQHARVALDMANRLAAPAKREAARLQLTCAALTGLIGTAPYPCHQALAKQAVDAADWCLDVLYPEVSNV